MRTERSPRLRWVLFLAGPVLWFVHFMAVYLLAEAACATGGSGPQVLGLPLLALVTLVATAIVVLAVVALAARARQRWRSGRAGTADWLSGEDTDPGLALAGALLGALFAAAILFVGVPAAFLDPC